jgi:hypothetical protein
MPDWKLIVRKKLRTLSACSPESAEELAGYLEDRYEGYLSDELLERTALQRTLDEIEHSRGKWLALRLLKEDNVKEFTRRMGLPGIVAFATAMVIAWALDAAHIQPKTIFLANGLFLSLPIAWFCLLPLCGALGAIVSSRNGGSRSNQLAAATFPASVMAVVLLLAFVVGWAISLFVKDSGWNWAIAVPGLALWLTTFSILTALPLLLGAVVAEQVRKKSAWIA